MFFYFDFFVVVFMSKGARAVQSFVCVLFCSLLPLDLSPWCYVSAEN